MRLSLEYIRRHKIQNNMLAKEIIFFSVVLLKIGWKIPVI